MTKNTKLAQAKGKFTVMLKPHGGGFRRKGQGTQRCWEQGVSSFRDDGRGQAAVLLAVQSQGRRGEPMRVAGARRKLSVF